MLYINVWQLNTRALNTWVIYLQSFFKQLSFQPTRVTRCDEIDRPFGVTEFIR
jgi:hypothetical protein